MGYYTETSESKRGLKGWEAIGQERGKKEVHSVRKGHHVPKKRPGKQIRGRGSVAKEGKLAAPRPQGLGVASAQGWPDSPFPPQGAPRPCWTSQVWISLRWAPLTQPRPPALVTRPAWSSPAPQLPYLTMSSCLWVRKGRGPEQDRLCCRWGVMPPAHEAAFRAQSGQRVPPPPVSPLEDGGEASGPFHS